MIAARERMGEENPTLAFPGFSGVARGDKTERKWALNPCVVVLELRTLVHYFTLQFSPG